MPIDPYRFLGGQSLPIDEEAVSDTGEDYPSLGDERPQLVAESPFERNLRLGGGIDKYGGGGNIIDLPKARSMRSESILRDRNFKETFKDTGGGIIKSLPNGWHIGWTPESGYVLVSPMGAPALYRGSVLRLIKDGFPHEEIPALLQFLKLK